MASSFAGLQLFKLSFLLSLFLNSELGVPQSVSKGGVAGQLPPSRTCRRLECPTYNVTEVGNGYEIRRCNSPVCISTSPIYSFSFVKATITGVVQLDGYIRGNNSDGRKIEMVGPVITEVSPIIDGADPLSFTVSFYLPKVNQANPPQAEGLHVERWEAAKYVAVRRFSGFVNDTNVKEEVAALRDSLGYFPGYPDFSYTVAQYNALFELKDRVNEIWFDFQE